MPNNIGNYFSLLRLKPGIFIKINLQLSHMFGKENVNNKRAWVTFPLSFYIALPNQCSTKREFCAKRKLFSAVYKFSLLRYSDESVLLIAANLETERLPMKITPQADVWNSLMNTLCLVYSFPPVWPLSMLYKHHYV